MFTDRNHTCCFTGHRHIEPCHLEMLPALLEQTLRRLISEGYYTFISGGAVGFDCLAAETVITLQEEFSHLRLIVISPCANQSEGWDRAEQLRYERILQAADDHICLEAAYTSGCMRRRNYALVERSAACISYCLRERSGTAQTVRFAEQEGLELISLSQRLETLSTRASNGIFTR